MSFNDSKPFFEPLDVDNYPTWSIRTKMLLKRKGLWSAIEPVAPAGDPAAAPRAVDPNIDEKALALICLSVTDHHLVSLASCATAKAAWDSLERTYKAKSNARILQLRRELYTLKMLSNEPLTKYVSRAKSLRDHLVAAGQSVVPSDIVFSVLNGLPDAYKPIIAVITSSESELDIDAVLPKLMMTEASLPPDSVASNSSGFYDTSALAATTGKPKKTCHYCGKAGHIEVNCFKKKRVENAATNPKTGSRSLAL
jgi:hypothetical protein